MLKLKRRKWLRNRDTCGFAWPAAWTGRATIRLSTRRDKKELSFLNQYNVCAKMLYISF